MLKKTLLAAAVASLACNAYAAKSEDARVKNISLSPLGTFDHGPGAFDEGAAEIVSHDPATQRLFVINANDKTVDVLDASNPTAPARLFQIDVSVDLPDSGGVNSVAVKNGLVAVAVEHDDKQANGWVAFYDTDGQFLNSVGAGALPDAVTFTPNGSYALAANEGEPSDDYTVDPEGSVTVIDLRDGVMMASAMHAGFAGFNGAAPAGVRISGPGASVAQDLEPEFIATSHDSRTAWVALQENNALAVVDIATATVTDLLPLGLKDHMSPLNALDASNRDDIINIVNWPVYGTYMPDGMDSFRAHGRTYLITANEGDGREYIYEANKEDCESAGHVWDGDDDMPELADDCISHLDEARVGDDEVVLDPVVFDDAAFLKKDENLGRIKMLSTEGDPDGDGKYNWIQVFGGRSISIWDESGTQVYDSGSIMEEVTAATLGGEDCMGGENGDAAGCFNSTNDENDSGDNRSDDKGPEPEGVVVGTVKGRQYAFVGLERVGGVMIFDVTRPEDTRYVSYINTRDFTVEDVEEDLADAGDLGPEGLSFIKADDSPTGTPLLVVGNEISGTTTIYEVIDE